MAIFGYARVSTDGQTLDAQVSALKAAGAVRVFGETASGAKTDRRELAQALKSLAEGDTLLVTRLDRLARSTRDLLNTLDTIAKAGAGFRSLGDAWADTTCMPQCQPCSSFNRLEHVDHMRFVSRIQPWLPRLSSRCGSSTSVNSPSIVCVLPFAIVPDA